MLSHLSWHEKNWASKNSNSNKLLKKSDEANQKYFEIEL